MAGDDDSPRYVSGEDMLWMDLFPVYDALSEDAAIHVRALLESAGVEARIRSAQIAGFNGAFASAVGYWGQVMVPRADVLRARQVLEDVQRGSPGGAEGDGAGEAPEPDRGGGG
jgi:hypothetical protein